MDFGAIVSAFLLGLVAKYPIITGVLMAVGVARAIFKPLFSFLHAVVDATPSSKDNAALAKVEKSKVYKIVAYLLDYLGSIKIEKPAAPAPAPAPAPEQPPAA